MLIGGTTPYQEMKMNFNETFNEICVMWCIYIVMVLMMSSNLEFQTSMTITFIVICAINIFNFGAQSAYQLIMSSFKKFNENKTRQQKKLNLDS